MTDIQNPGQENESGAELRRKLEQANARVKELETANEQWAQYGRTSKAQALFRSRGLSDEHAELFLGTHQGDVNETVVDEFVSRYKLSPSRVPEAERGRSPDIHYPGADPMARAGNVQSEAVGEPKQIGYGEFERMMTEDPVEATRLVMSGQVQLMKRDSASVIAGLPSRPQPMIPPDNTS